MCILKIPSAFAEPLRLVKELVNESVEQMNSISKSTDQHRSFHLPKHQLNNFDAEDGQKLTAKKKRSVSFESKIPDWGLETKSESNILDKSSDSGVDSINEQNKQNKPNGLTDHKIADGKIIFSFLPQVLPISDQTMNTQCLSSKLEISISHLICSWSLMVTLNNYDSIDLNENEIVCKAIQQAFINFTSLFLNIEFDAIKDFFYFDNEHLAQNEQIHMKKLKALVKIFFILVKTLNFACTDSIGFGHVCQLVQKFNQSILKLNNSMEVDGDRGSARIYVLSLAYNLLKSSQTILRPIFNQRQNESFLIKFDSIECTKNAQHCKELASLNAIKTKVDIVEPSEQSNESNSDRFETDSLEKLNNKKSSLILSKLNVKQSLNQIDFMLQKSWKNLLHYTKKYRKTLQSLGKIRQNWLNEINVLVIFVQREIEKLSNFKNFSNKSDTRGVVAEEVSNHKSVSSVKIGKADLVYFNLGNLDKAIDFWTIQLNSMFDQPKTLVLEQRSIVIVHKMFYSCLAKYEIVKFLNILEKFVECEQCKYLTKNGQNHFSPFSLFENSFKTLCIPKPLPKLPLALISILKSLARFVSLYLINHHELFHLSVTNATPMPSLAECVQNAELNAKKNVLCKQKFSSSLNSRDATPNIGYVFTADKVVEMFLATELYDEAICFLNFTNDWKSSFLINSILKESSNYPHIEQNSLLLSEHQLASRLSSILGLNASDSESCLMEKAYAQSAAVVLKELLVCSVVTKWPILQPVLTNLMKSFVACTRQMFTSSIVVPQNFYLPAPPIFCTQLNTEHNEDNEDREDQLSLHESKCRDKLCLLSKCIIVLFKESNLFVAMIKWYLENLCLAKSDMTNVYGIRNKFSLDLSLSNLLSSIRYQKIGYIPEQTFGLFREFVSLLFLIELRDKFCHTLRHLTKLTAKSANNSPTYIDLSCKIIKYGMLILSFRCLMADEYERIQDIVLSTIAKLATSSLHSSELDLEYELVKCIEDKIFAPDLLTSLDGRGFSVRNKFEAIRDEWKQRSEEKMDMDELFEYKMKIVNKENQLIQSYYGMAEDIFHLKYVQNVCDVHDSFCGSFAIERSDLMADFLEFFFKFAFDESQNWHTIIHHVNNIPLIPQFCDLITEQELNKNELKKYVLKKKNSSTSWSHLSNESTHLHKSLTKRRSSRLAANSSNRDNQSTKCAIDGQILNKSGLFRTYSLTTLNRTQSSLTIKSASLDHLNKSAPIKTSNCDHTGLEQPLALLDYGPAYAHVSNLAIWLVKWSTKFQKILVQNNKILNRFDNGKHFECKTTLKLNCLNANMLVACVYLANGNNLVQSSQNQCVLRKQMHRVNEPNEPVSQMDDDFTQVTRSNMDASKKIGDNSLMNKKFNNDISSQSSSTLDISSYDHIKCQSKSIEDKCDTSTNYQRQTKFVANDKSLLAKSEPLLDTLPSALDVTEYYDFENLKKAHHLNKSEVELFKDEKKIDEPAVIGEPKIDDENKSEIKKKKNSFEFITNFFKSPTKLVEKNEAKVCHQNKACESKDKNQQEYEPASTANTFNHNNDSSQVHQIIKNELKKIVQLQHDTVMNFLNNQSNEPHVNQSDIGLNGFENQLITILKSASSSDAMSQIVIETNVKKVHNKSMEYFSNQNQAMHQANQANQANFSHRPQITPAHSIALANSAKKNKNIATHNKCSKFVKIPLLNIKDDDDDADFHLPSVVTNMSNKYFTKSNYISGKSPQLTSVKMQTTQNLKTNDKIFHKHLQILSQNQIKKKFNCDIKNYPLLKLNVSTTNQSCHHTQFDQATIESKQIDETKFIEEKSTQKQEISVKVDKSLENAQTAKSSSDAQTQVQKPMYDGYILAPDCFDKMIDSHQIDYFSSAKAHYESTQHLRVQQDYNKKDSYTMTEKNIQTSHQLPPDILFKLKFDNTQKDRQKECELNNDFINIADLDFKSVEEILQLINIDQSKRLKIPIVKSQKNAQHLNNELNVSRSIDLVSLNDKGALSRDSHIQNDSSNLNKDLIEKAKIEALNVCEENLSDDLLADHVFSDLPIIDQKIQSINKMADKINDENVRNMKCVETEIQDCIDRIECVEQSSMERTTQKKDKQVAIHEIQFDSAHKDSDHKLMDNEHLKHIDLSDDLSDLNDLEQQRLHDILQEFDRHPLINPSSSQYKVNKKPKAQVKEKIALGKKQNEQLKKSNDNVSFTKRIENELIEKRENMIEKFAQKREQDAKNLLKDLISDTTQVNRNCSQTINSARSNKKSSAKANHLVPRKNIKNEIEIPPLLFKTNDADSVLSGSKISTLKAKPSLMSKTINKLALQEQIENKKTQILLDELEKRAHNVTNRTNTNKTQINIKDAKSLSHYVRLQNPKKLRTQPVHKALTYSQRLMMHQKSDIKLANSKDNINELYKVYGSKRVKGIHQHISGTNFRQAVANARPENGAKKILQHKNKMCKGDNVNVNKILNNSRYSPYDQCILSKDIEELIHWSVDDSLKRIIYDDNKPKSRLNNKSKIKNKKDLKASKDMDQDTLADLDMDYLNDDFLDEHLIDNESYLNQVGIQDLVNISLSSESSISFIDWDQIDQICEHYQK
ncbi:hypothetical protein BpHYR1_050019 [Brachionus plicatilis]|uniref:Uncharacterized protein n=1 Tax=Brachionus plicatilis TaxID=10195 RepID=A0A3M7S141_BRAPC|nr:hypothetical protein BpHYR1_050019 [Brachionus plicatilis]